MTDWLIGLALLASMVPIVWLFGRASRRTGVVVSALSLVIVAVLASAAVLLPPDSTAASAAFYAAWPAAWFAVFGLIYLLGWFATEAPGTGALGSFGLAAAVLLAGALLPGDAGFLLGPLAGLVAVVGLIYLIQHLYRRRRAVRSGAARVLSSGTARIEVVTDRSEYAPGDLVDASVRIEAVRDLDFREARVELAYSNRYSYLTHGVQNESTFITATHDATAAAESPMGPGRLARGEVAEHAVSLELPTGVPPSADGRITGVDWRVRAVLDVPGGVDASKEVPIAVISGAAGGGGGVEEDSDTTSAAGYNVDLRLPRSDFAAGERIEGVLAVSVRAGREDETIGLRVELVRTEAVPRDAGNYEDEVEARETVARRVALRAGAASEHPFALDVPDPVRCPSFVTRHATVEWWLRAVVVRRLRSDPALERKVRVRTAGAASQAVRLAG